jgi:hypothetical protein
LSLGWAGWLTFAVTVSLAGMRVIAGPFRLATSTVAVAGGSHSDRDLGCRSHDCWSEVRADSPKTAVSLTLAHVLTLFFWSKDLDPEYVHPSSLCFTTRRCPTLTAGLAPTPTLSTPLSWISSAIYSSCWLMSSAFSRAKTSSSKRSRRGSQFSLRDAPTKAG